MATILDSTVLVFGLCRGESSFLDSALRNKHPRFLAASQKCKLVPTSGLCSDLSPTLLLPSILK